MGQGYMAVILSDDGKFIRTWVHPHNYGNGYKLTEHSYIGNRFVSMVESLLCPEGMFYKCRVVWAGDYADNEAGLDTNLHHLASSPINVNKAFNADHVGDMTKYRYLVNHSKRLYVDKNLLHDAGGGYDFHPLPLLTAEGNGRGGGDYSGSNAELVGTWARDVISVEDVYPENYSELSVDFSEQD